MEKVLFRTMITKTICQKVLKGAAEFWKKVFWTDQTQMNLHQSDGKKKVWRPTGTKIQSIAAPLLNTVVGVLWCGHVRLPQVLAHLSSLMMELLMAAAQ